MGQRKVLILFGGKFKVDKVPSIPHHGTTCTTLHKLSVILTRDSLQYPLGKTDEEGNLCIPVGGQPPSKSEEALCCLVGLGTENLMYNVPQSAMIKTLKWNSIDNC